MITINNFIYKRSRTHSIKTRKQKKERKKKQIKLIPVLEETQVLRCVGFFKVKSYRFSSLRSTQSFHNRPLRETKELHYYIVEIQSIVES